MVKACVLVSRTNTASCLIGFFVGPVDCASQGSLFFQPAQTHPSFRLASQRTQMSASFPRRSLVEILQLCFTFQTMQHCMAGCRTRHNTGANLTGPSLRTCENSDPGTV